MDSRADRYDRECYVRILPYGKSQDEKNWIEFRGLDVKFDISKPIGAVCMEAQISILGLSWEHIKMLSSWAADAVEFCRANRIQVYAGYKKIGATCIFDGSIIYAMPTMPPNVWLNITARSGYYRCAVIGSGDASNSSLSSKPFNEWLKDSFAFLEIDCDTSEVADITAKTTVKAYEEPVTLQRVLFDIKRECAKNSVIMIETIQENGKSKYTFQKRWKNCSKNPLVISMDTGMVGIPKITWNEIEVTTFLATNVDGIRGNFIEVYSRFALPGLYDKKQNRKDAEHPDLYHDTYRVNNVRYHGHFRGNEWFTTYKAWRYFEESDEKKPTVELKDVQ